MLSSYITSVGFKGSRHIDKDIPSVFEIQDFIETAWDNGINAQGRAETGGIKGTRKYIGTPEVCRSFLF
jgi:zinc finger-containing ubiquitin peptidase 1